MTKTTSRRAILAGAAAMIPATASVALPALDGPDPIFAAIERHRDAYMKQAASNRVAFHFRFGTPEYREADEVRDADNEVFDDASYKLLETIPTTAAGGMALLLYVLDVNDGALALDPWPDSTREDWASSLDTWPRMGDDDEIDEYGRMAWMLLRNAAQAIAVQS